MFRLNASCAALRTPLESNTAAVALCRQKRPQATGRTTIVLTAIRAQMLSTILALAAKWVKGNPAHRTIRDTRRHLLPGPSIPGLHDQRIPFQRRVQYRRARACHAPRAIRRLATAAAPRAPAPHLPPINLIPRSLCLKHVADIIHNSKGGSPPARTPRPA